MVENNKQIKQYDKIKTCQQYSIFEKMQEIFFLENRKSPTKPKTGNFLN